MLDYQLTVFIGRGHSYVRLSLKVRSQYETYTYTVHVRIHVAPLALLPIP